MHHFLFLSTPFSFDGMISVHELVSIRNLAGRGTTKWIEQKYLYLNAV